MERDSPDYRQTVDSIAAEELALALLVELLLERPDGDRVLRRALERIDVVLDRHPAASAAAIQARVGERAAEIARRLAGPGGDVQGGA